MMKKYLSAVVVLIALFGTLFVVACGGKAPVLGTWTFEKATYEGTTYTVDEIKSMGGAAGSDIMSMIDATIVIKEGEKSNSGSALISSAGQTAPVEWSLSGKTITIGVQECEYDGEYIVIPTNEDSKMYFKKTSESQELK